MAFAVCVVCDCDIDFLCLRCLLADYTTRFPSSFASSFTSASAQAIPQLNAGCCSFCGRHDGYLLLTTSSGLQRCAGVAKIDHPAFKVMTKEKENADDAESYSVLFFPSNLNDACANNPVASATVHCSHVVPMVPVVEGLCTHE